MANAKSKRRWGRALAFVLIVALAGLALLWFSAPGERLRGDAVAGTAYAARVGCSCRFVAGRTMADCAKDKLAGMELISLSADEEARSVTARIPLLASDTARLRPGYGCVSEDWRARDG